MRNETGFLDFRRILLQRLVRSRTGVTRPIKHGQVEPAQHAQSMGLAGCTALIVVNFTHPIEVCKTRLQVDGSRWERSCATRVRWPCTKASRRPGCGGELHFGQAGVRALAKCLGQTNPLALRVEVWRRRAFRVDRIVSGIRLTS